MKSTSVWDNLNSKVWVREQTCKISKWRFGEVTNMPELTAWVTEVDRAMTQTQSWCKSCGFSNRPFAPSLSNKNSPFPFLLLSQYLCSHFLFSLCHSWFQLTGLPRKGQMLGSYFLLLWPHPFWSQVSIPRGPSVQIHPKSTLLREQRIKAAWQRDTQGVVCMMVAGSELTLRHRLCPR